MENRLFIATLGKSVGLKGELKLNLSTDFPEQFKKDEEFFYSKSGNQILTVEYYYPKRDVVKFKEINSIEESKKYINKMLYTSLEKTKSICRLNKNEFFWFDIINLKVYDRDKYLGTVKRVDRLGASDYLVISTDEDLIKQNLTDEFLIPYVDRYIKDVDLNQKSIKTEDTFELLEIL